MTARAFKWLVAVFILIATLFVYRDLVELWFTDIDTFPLISTGRMGSPGDFIDILTSPLMQGLMPNALFYRPLTSISYGIDASVWGLKPFGYHLTDLAIHVANSLMLFFLVRNTAQQLSPDAAAEDSRVTQNDLAALTAAFIFAIHPITMEVVPAIARRADLLYSLFLLLMLLSLHKALMQRRALDIGLATFYCVLAFAAKDSALSLPAIAIAFVFCFAEATTIKSRLKQCLRSCWPMVIAAALWLGVRAMVLGGLGGYAAIEGWAHQSPAKAAYASIRPLFCTVFLSGNLDTCIAVPRTLLIGCAAVIFASFALVGWRMHRGNESYPLLRILAFAALSLLAILSLHAVAGTPAFIRTLYSSILFISIVMGCGLIILPQSILALGKMRDSQIVERAVHILAGIILIAATGSLLRGAWSGQIIEEWHAGAEMEKLAFTDLAEGMATVPPNSIVYLVNVPWKGSRLIKPLRDHPMPIEHSIQGFVDLAFPDKNLEVVALSFVTINVEDPAGVASTISFQPKPARLDIQTGSRGTPSRRVWIISYPRKSPWRDNTYSGNRRDRRIRIDLNPDMAIEDHAVFFVYTGGRVVRREATTPWTVQHLPPET